MTQDYVTNEQFKQAMDKIEGRLDKHNKTLYGNGEPGLDEIMRNVNAWIKRREETEKTRNEKQDKYMLLLVSTAVGMVATFIGGVLMWFINIYPELARLAELGK